MKKYEKVTLSLSQGNYTIGQGLPLATLYGVTISDDGKLLSLEHFTQARGAWHAVGSQKLKKLTTELINLLDNEEHYYHGKH